jgi:hypothetical protein
LRAYAIAVSVLVTLVFHFAQISLASAGTCVDFLKDPHLNRGLQSILIRMIKEFEFRTKYVGLIRQGDGFLRHQETACAPVCVINILQVLRVAFGKAPISNGVEIINRLREEDPSTLNGMNLPRMSRFFKKLMTRYLPGVSYSTNSKILDFAYDADFKSASKGAEVVKRFYKSDLKTSDRQLQILGFMLIEHGQLVDQHVMILVGRTGDVIQVVDPNFPHQIINFDLDEIRINNSARTFQATSEPNFFMDDASWARSNLYLNSILTISLD